MVASGLRILIEAVLLAFSRQEIMNRLKLEQFQIVITQTDFEAGAK
jgi:hypothetical protein